MEEIIIDGCNLAYKAYGGAGDKERNALLSVLKNYYSKKRILVTLVFDSSTGADVQHPIPNLKVRYAPAPADDYIVRYVSESQRRSTLTVVTDDLSIAGKVRSLGSRHIRSRDFLASWKGWQKIGAHPPSDQEKPREENPEEMKRYLTLWGGKKK